MISVEARIQDAALTSMENLVNLRVELAMNSASSHSERRIAANVFKPEQRDFLGKIEGLRMTASSRINSHMDLNRIDKTRSSNTVEEGDLLVNGKNIDWQTHAHHSCYDGLLLKLPAQNCCMKLPFSAPNRVFATFLNDGNEFSENK